MSALVECVPNFSEGRRDDTIAALRDVIDAVDDAQVLDVHAAADRLVAQVNARGGPDNVSIVLVRTGDQFLRDKKEIAKLSKESNG